MTTSNNKVNSRTAFMNLNNKIISRASRPNCAVSVPSGCQSSQPTSCVGNIDIERSLYVGLIEASDKCLSLCQ